MNMMTEAVHLAAAPDMRGAAIQGGEFLTFRLGAESYAIGILGVQEIRSYEPPTRIANAPAFVKGVINLRGTIVPIIDLRLRLGCAAAEYDSFTAVIVINVRGHVAGVVVDSVRDVVEFGAEQILPPPEFASAPAASFISGIAKIEDQMLIVMDIGAAMQGVESVATAH